MFNIFKRKQGKNLVDENLIDKSILRESVDVDMNNVIKSIFHAESLYDKLKIKCHPDRFVEDPLLMKRADDIFKEISENKRNFDKLKELAKIADKELNIKL